LGKNVFVCKEPARFGKRHHSAANGLNLCQAELAPESVTGHLAAVLADLAAGLAQEAI